MTRGTDLLRKIKIGKSGSIVCDYDACIAHGVGTAGCPLYEIPDELIDRKI